MTTYNKGDMWSAWDRAALFLITTNSYVKRNGSLVMGRGIARQARDRFSGVDMECGRVIEGLARDRNELHHLPYFTYGLLTPFIGTGRVYEKLGLFQVKHHWREKALPQLIRVAVEDLMDLTYTYELDEIHLNFPGIGNGGLSRDVVKPIVDVLPDNVHIWEYE